MTRRLVGLLAVAAALLAAGASGARATSRGDVWVLALIPAPERGPNQAALLYFMKCLFSGDF